MKITTLLGSAALMLLPMTGAALAQDASTDLPPCDNCSNDLTIMSWGGAYQDATLKAYIQPYADATGVTVTFDESAADGVAKLRAMSEAGNVTVDLVDALAADAIRLCDEGLVQEIPFDEWLAPAPDGTSATEDLGDNIVSECHIPTNAYSTTFGYRTDVAEWNGATPTSICDIFDTEKFPGKRSLEQRPVGNMEWALICDGVPADQVYDTLETEEGVQQALAKLDTIKDDVIWWTAGAETPQLLADKEVVIGDTYNGRLFSLIAEQNQPVAMLWDYEVLDLDGFVVPKDLPEDRLNRVKHFLRFATDTEHQAALTKYISYGPLRASSQPLVGQHATLGIDMAPHLPTTPENAAHSLVFNYGWWADHRDELDAQFQAWLSQ
ncbi:Spermidine/putrescine-binding protein periplasmic protein [Rubellimicrobium mesophilum DSM 19309]|uniref:Spermidine/putrescine-binding protein periplasmic protein n=1 Tax=Rubellimicrobium mesophilum DSM 19309 TaxID=442562 RepID=A0A017HSH1_9RHOB|nr:extracellular solute-binding protein [Rubellimicrobium mesophilum]EYD77285.1 Spermidine/putrescine-binding protein periplasmic protein [Rubellimicrobium mesophilum DSM 19309]